MAFEADLPQIFHYHPAGSTPPTLIYVPRCIRNFRICPQVGAPACKSSVPSMQTPKHAAQIPVTTIPHPAHTGMTGGNGAIRYYQIVDRYIVPILTVTIHAPTARVRTQTLWYDVYILSLVWQPLSFYAYPIFCFAYHCTTTSSSQPHASSAPIKIGPFLLPEPSEISARNLGIISSSCKYFSM